MKKGQPPTAPFNYATRLVLGLIGLAWLLLELTVRLIRRYAPQ
jgi:hypothetical protein